LSSRERVLAAINHQTPDRVPLDLGATPSSGISAIAYSNLVKHIGMPELPVQIYDVVQQLAQPDMKVLERLEIFSEGSGFVFNTVHNILPDVPPENVVAMFDAINEFNNLK
jgi:uroporphyrinogen decarboxylase